ncbi:DNA-binding protein [Paracidovorax citrulli]
MNEEIRIPAGLMAIARGRDALPTTEAAHVLSRTSDTLHKWASLGTGPIRPLRINGRLSWRVIDLAKLLEGNDGAR